MTVLACVSSSKIARMYQWGEPNFPPYSRVGITTPPPPACNDRMLSFICSHVCTH